METTPQQHEPIKKTPAQVKAYNKFYNKHAERLKERSRLNYIYKINNDPNYREILRNRTHQQKIKKLTLEGKELQQRGRPRKNKEEEEQYVKKIGRPRKYDVLTTEK